MTIFNEETFSLKSGLQKGPRVELYLIVFKLCMCKSYLFGKLIELKTLRILMSAFVLPAKNNSSDLFIGVPNT